MESQNLPRRLSCISTSWSAVCQAHLGQGEAAAAAQRLVLLRYYQPIRRYLLAMVRDEDAAEELTQEFVVRFLRGDFRRADPSRGRFRDLLRRALRHLAIDHWRRERAEKARQSIPLADDWPMAPPREADWRREPPPPRPQPAAPPGEIEWRGEAPPLPGRPQPDFNTAEADRTFLEEWRAEMLEEAWEALAAFQGETGRPYHTVLSLRAHYPDYRSPALGRLVGLRLGRTLGEAAFRQLLRRARQKFADLLVEAVARTLLTRDADSVEEELSDLGLLPWCRQSVARLRRR